MIQWDECYADRAQGVAASEIRELLKFTMRPEVISFAGGLPHPKTFPVEDIYRIAQSVLFNSSDEALQYTTTEGHIELRKFLAARERSVGVFAGVEEILVTSGSQQGLELISKTLLNPNDKVIVEEPSYIGGISAFNLYQSQLLPIALEEDGPDLGDLEAILKKSERPPKFFYAIPTFQNPSGITYSKSKRKELAEISAEHDLIIVEDNPYAKLRFKGESKKSIKYYAPDSTIYLSTFSKILSPGFRMAWICAPKELVRKLVIVKQATDLCSSTFLQMITYQLLRRGLIDKHIPWIAALYKEKCDMMLDAMDEYFPPDVTWTRPEGGMFIWVTLPEHVDTKKMFDDALKNNVAYVHGGAFYTRGGHNHMRLSFASPDNDKIQEGIQRLGKVIREYI